MSGQLADLEALSRAIDNVATEQVPDVREALAADGEAFDPTGTDHLLSIARAGVIEDLVEWERAVRKGKIEAEDKELVHNG